MTLGGSGARVSSIGDGTKAKFYVTCNTANDCGESNYYTTRFGVHGAADGGYHNRGIVGEASGGYSNYGVYGSASNGSYNFAGYFSGTIYYTGTVCGSDQRMKRNIRALSAEGSMLEQVMRLQPRVYEYRHEGQFARMNLPEGEQMGLVAQEVEQVLPGVVREVVAPNGNVQDGADAEPLKGIDYPALIPVLIQAVQEQQARIEALEAALQQEGIVVPQPNAGQGR